jgi:hypothetical protein
LIPAAIISQAAADGVHLALGPSSAVKATGEKAAIERWAATIRDHKAAIVELLKCADLDAGHPTPVGDPDLHRQWRVEIPGREAFSVIVVPEANVEQMQTRYPTATSIVAEAG